VRLGARSRARLGARLGASAKRAPERVHCVRSAGLLTCACQDRAGPQVMIDISRLPTGTLFLQGEPKGTRGREEPDLGRLNLRRFKHSRADQPPPRSARGYRLGRHPRPRLAPRAPSTRHTATGTGKVVATRTTRRVRRPAVQGAAGTARPRLWCSAVSVDLTTSVIFAGRVAAFGGSFRGTCRGSSGAASKRALNESHCGRSAGLLTCACQDQATRKHDQHFPTPPTGTPSTGERHNGDLGGHGAAPGSHQGRARRGPRLA
jgi:hypothetical protein